MSEIVAGVARAQKAVIKKGARVNPCGAMIGRSILESSLHDASTNSLIDMVEFDLCVSTEKGTKTKGTIGIVIASFGLGSQGASTATDTQQNRIKFRVPLQLPPHA